MPEKTRISIFKRIDNITIANKITILYGGVSAAILLLASLFIILNANLYYRDLSQKEISQTADKVAEHIEAGGEITEEALRSLNPNKYVEIKVFNIEDRRVVIQFSEAAQAFDFPEPPHQDEIVAQRLDELNSGKAIRGKLVRAAFPRYMFGERFAAYGNKTYAVQVYRQYAVEHKILKVVTILLIVVSVLGIAISFGIGRYISGRMLKPITDIRQAAERISIEDLSRRIPVEGPNDELKELALTFNAMIERLEASFVKQNQFVSDASHELRTPISVIQGYANLIDRWGKKDEAVLQESIDSIKTETEHMGTLVKKLLFLAKGEQNKLIQQKIPLSLNSLTADVVKEITIMGMKADISVEAISEETILGDYDLIKQMLWVFIDNSIKYANDEKGSVLIKIFQEEERSCISIADEGIGICAEDLPLIFERFYRADKSRSNEVPGTGLGLSIASWIIKQHDAVVDVKSILGKGTEITVRFPRYIINDDE